VLSRPFGTTRETVTEGWRKLNSEQLHNSYFTLNIIREIKSRKMRWAGNTIHIERSKMNTQL
jgi:hypothetical protein